MWRVAFAIAVACSAPADTRLSNEVRSAVQAPEITLVSRLSELAVSDDDFYRPVLYSWTTPANIAALRQSHRVLTATASTGGFVSPFLRALALVASHAGPGRDVAHMLITDPVLLRRRYAWPHPFATVLGIGDRTYGTALIRLELDPRAWIGRFDPTSPQPFLFRDAHGSTIAIGDVLAHPEMIGAIFHVRTDTAVPFREYVVCNATMLASWSVSTPQIRAKLDAELATIAAVARAPDVSLDRWNATLAFYNARYRPTPTALATLAAALAAYDPAGAALSIP